MERLCKELLIVHPGLSVVHKRLHGLDSQRWAGWADKAPLGLKTGRAFLETE